MRETWTIVWDEYGDGIFQLIHKRTTQIESHTSGVLGSGAGFSSTKGGGGIDWTEVS